MSHMVIFEMAVLLIWVLKCLGNIAQKDHDRLRRQMDSVSGCSTSMGPCRTILHPLPAHPGPGWLCKAQQPQHHERTADRETAEVAVWDTVTCAKNPVVLRRPSPSSQRDMAVITLAMAAPASEKCRRPVARGKECRFCHVRVLAKVGGPTSGIVLVADGPPVATELPLNRSSQVTGMHRSIAGGHAA